MLPGKVSRTTFPSLKEFRVHAGFVNDPPHELTAALGVFISSARGMKGVPSTHKLLIGGPKINFHFQLGCLYSHDKHDIESTVTKIQGSQEPSGIDFRHSSSVTDWAPIHEKFHDSLSSPGVDFNWAANPCIQVRWGLAADIALTMCTLKLI